MLERRLVAPGGDHRVPVIQRGVGLGEVGAGMGAAALLSEQRAAGDQAGQRVRVGQVVATEIGDVRMASCAP